MSEDTPEAPRGGLSAADLELFNRQILTAARAGAPLVPALKALSRDLRRGRLKAAVDSLTQDLQTGQSLSEALSRHREQFPPLYAAMADAAAASGNLQGVMEMVSHLVTAGAALHRKVITAAAYPIFVLCAATGVLVFLMTALLPRVKDIRRILTSFGTGRSTVGPLGFGTAASIIGVSIVLGVLLLLLLIRILPGGRQWISALARRLPLYGAVVRSQRAFLFCRTLSVLLRAGVPMRKALAVVREVAPERSQKRALDQVQQDLHAGARLSEALAAQSFGMAAPFPPALVWTVSVAESRGDLPEGLYETSEFYREDAERRSMFLIQVLPTFLIIFVGIFVVAAIQPLFGMFIELVNLMTSVGSGF